MLFGEKARPFLDEAEEFLTGLPASSDLDRMLVTILFTDIVDSTWWMMVLGDRVWQDHLDAHNAMVRRQLARFKGREIKTMGDGFLATFQQENDEVNHPKLKARSLSTVPPDDTTAGRGTMAEESSIHPFVSGMAAVHRIYTRSLDAAPDYIESAREMTRAERSSPTSTPTCWPVLKTTMSGKTSSIFRFSSSAHPSRWRSSTWASSSTSRCWRWWRRPRPQRRRGSQRVTPTVQSSCASSVR